jgi:hypothetical protein
MILKPNALVYIRRTDLFIGGKHLSAVKLKFSEALIKDMEILDYENFVKLCSDFFITHDLKSKRVLMVLDQGLVFSKSKPASEVDESALMHSYIEMMPFDPGQRTCISRTVDDQVHVFATNADIYKAIQDALGQAGNRKIYAIAPAAAYKINYASRPGSVIDQFLEDKDAPKLFDFSTTNAV